MNRNSYLSLYKEQILTVIILLFVSIISFNAFNSKIICSDDWSFIVSNYVFGKLHPIDLSDRRPLLLSSYYVLAAIFGLRFEYYYFANFLILFSSACLVYFILKQTFPEYGWLASLTALTFLFYPVDYTRTSWLIMINIRLAWMFGLAAIWLLLEFVKSGNWWSFVAAMIAIAVPLGGYEGQVGVIAIAGVFIAFFMSEYPIKRRLISLSGVLFIGVLFLIWRFFIQVNILAIHDTYVETIQTNPVILLKRYAEGLKIFTVGWLPPILTQLRRSSFEMISLWLLWIIIGNAVIRWILSKRTSGATLASEQKASKIKSFIKLFLTGMAFWVAGYIPIIALYPPMLGGHASRVNLFAIPGAALMLVSAIAMLATLITRSTFAMRSMTAVILLPFILAGIFVQFQVNHENQVAWDTQKEIWNSVFEVIPNIANQKSVVVIVPGYQHLRPFQAFPFQAGWEIESGAQVLYNNPSIGGQYFYKDIQSTDLFFTPKGFKPIPTDKAISFKKLIFVYYHPESQTVELVENLEDTLSLPYEISNYSPHDNIAPANPETAKFRWLVQ